MKRFAIKRHRGAMVHFANTGEESKAAFMATRKDGETWEDWRERGCELVQVKIEVVAVIEGSTKPDRSDEES